MSVRLPSSQTQSAVGVVMTAATESIIGLLTGIIPSQDTAQVVILWYFDFTTGTAATGFTVRIRRGSAITSLLVQNSSVIPCAAGVIVTHSGMCVDSPTTAQGATSYVLTVQQTAATGNGLLGAFAMAAFIL